MRFHGRWDSIDAKYRTMYTGDSLLACLIELLAPFRPDPVTESEIAQVQEDPEDRGSYPTQPMGLLPIDEWLLKRQAGTARMSGTFCVVTSSRTVAPLAPTFRGVARVFGLDDFDTAALKSARPRELTQQVSQHLWEAGSVSGGDLCDGIEFASRHGDDLKLWAIFERPQDGDTSLRLTQITPRHLTRDTPELLEACDRLRIKAV